MGYIDNVIGDDSQHAKNAVRETQSHLDTVYVLPLEDFKDRILQSMQQSYPERFRHIDQDGLQSLIPKAKQLAESISATSHSAETLFFTLMFAFGHRFHQDPLYPWISGTLENDKAIKDPNERVDRLFKKTKMYVDQMLNHLETA